MYESLKETKGKDKRNIFDKMVVMKNPKGKIHGSYILYDVFSSTFICILVKFKGKRVFVCKSVKFTDSTTNVYDIISLVILSNSMNDYFYFVDSGQLYCLFHH